MRGTLYIVSTPIGNLQDITYRAVQVLSEVELIACEDTRHSRRLLDHYAIRTPLVSYHEHNEVSRSGELARRLGGGARMALISDAGTPLVSDPGYRLVNAAIEAGAAVVPVPGPSALLAALAVSGLPTDAFYFGGFLPAKQGARKRVLESLADLESVLVFYEAPHRIVESLETVAELFPDRQLVIGRELTKLHEEVWRGTAVEALDEWRSRPRNKGEFVLLIGKPAEANAAGSGSAREAFNRHLATGLTRMDAIKAAARECGFSKRDLYKLLEED